MYENPHGKAAGLSGRLHRFADALCTDRKYPWMGTGIVDDLRAAAATIDGQPLPKTLDEVEAAALEYDL
jgi:hypothetical protein